MRNGGKKGLVPYGPAYRDLIQLRRDDLRGIATRALEMQGIEESERDNIERALDLLGSIDALVKILDKHPSHVQQAHALVHLWKVIGAVFVIGSRGIKNPLTEKFLKDKTAQSTAHARDGRKPTKHRGPIDKIIADHVADYGKLKGPKRTSKKGIAERIHAGVMADLKKKLGIGPFGPDWLRKRISAHLKLGRTEQSRQLILGGLNSRAS
jgi:hypothetical protein